MNSSNKYFIKDNPSKRNIKYNAKMAVATLKSIYYKFNSFFINQKIPQKKYNVSICAIFKNEANYLKEWIEFNHLVGVDHFYLYNNNSDDNYLEIIKSYVENGLVTLIQWPYNQQQMQCYMSCIKEFSFETKWLGFIDIDEFVVPKTTDSIYDFLKPFEKKAGSVNIYWRLFGTSGRINRKLDELVCEDFTVCWPKYCDIGKCFYNTAFGFDFESKYAKQLHHKFWANYNGKNIPPVNIFNHICVGERNVADSNDFPIQINHYFTKSYKEYAMKRAKGDVYFKINPHDEKYFYEHESKCTFTDYSAYKYLVNLKLRLGKNNNEV